MPGPRLGAAVLGLTLAYGATAAAATPASQRARVVPPRVHALGVEPQTVAAFELLLMQEIERRQEVALVPPAPEAVALAPCATAECAGRRARDAGADAAFLCTLTRLGEKHVATLQQVDVSGNTTWSQRLVAASENDLETLAVELATLAGGRRSSRFKGLIGGPEPSERLAWRGSGPRVGAMYPLGESFAGARRLTSVAYVWRYQTPAFTVESVPALGIAWGGDLATDRGKGRDWTLLDVYTTWTPTRGDLAPYFGIGLGLHALRLERDGTGVPFLGRRDESATTVAMALGSGLMLFRTYDFQLVIDLRYQKFWNDFTEVGGTGAQAFTLTFGLHHR